MQAAGDIFLGWVTAETWMVRRATSTCASSGTGRGRRDVERMSARELGVYASLCGETLARAHARSGDRIAIAAYLGGGEVFDEAIADFAETYAEQNQRDFEAAETAASKGEISVEAGV